MVSSEKQFRLDDLQVNAEWEPPPDEIFQYLLQEAALGRVPLYFAAVPLARLKRFAQEFHPENTPDGPNVVAQIMQRWRVGEFSKMWVYQKGDDFIVSDDYFTLAAVEIGQPDFVPCWILGNITSGNAEQVQGPIPRDTILGMLGVKRPQ